MYGKSFINRTFWIILVLSINNPEFGNYLEQMYPAELEIKDTTESITSAFLSRFTTVDWWRDGHLHTSIYDKRGFFSISTSQTFRLWKVIFHLRLSMAFLSLSLIRYTRCCSIESPPRIDLPPPRKNRPGIKIAPEKVYQYRSSPTEKKNPGPNLPLRKNRPSIKFPPLKH